MYLTESGEPLSEDELKRQYGSYIDELRVELPQVQPCSFDDWLRGEIADGCIRQR